MQPTNTQVNLRAYVTHAVSAGQERNRDESIDVIRVVPTYSAKDLVKAAAIPDRSRARRPEPFRLQEACAHNGSQPGATSLLARKSHC